MVPKVEETKKTKAKMGMNEFPKTDAKLNIL